MVTHNMKLLIDMDLICYRGIFASKNGGYFSQLRICNDMLQNILDRFHNSEYLLFLSGSNNFRKKIYPLYKSNRGEKPPNLYDIKLWFQKYWGAIITDGVEADDAISTNQNETTIVVSYDKDMKQIPGWHYNFVKDQMFFVDDPSLFFWIQALTGDSSDFIPGLKNPEKLHHKNPPNFTEATARKILESLSPEERKEKVQELYQTVYGDGWFWRFDQNCRLLYLRRSENDEYYNTF